MYSEAEDVKGERIKMDNEKIKDILIDIKYELDIINRSSENANDLLKELEEELE